MDKYKISTTTTCDLDIEYFEKHDIIAVPSLVIIDEKVIFDDYRNIQPSEFYEYMRQGRKISTSGNNETMYYDNWKEAIDNGYKILHIDLSSGISISYSNALKAAKTINEKMGEDVVYVIDSLNASTGQGYLVDQIYDKKEEMSIQELYEYGLNIRSRVNSWFTSTDLTYYFKGGRISKTSMIVGNTLKICPILHVDENGKLMPKRKARGEEKAIKTLVDIMEERADKGLNYDGKVFITNSDYRDRADFLRELILDRFSNVNGVSIYDVHTNIGGHTGPGTVALIFLGKHAGE